MTARRSLAALVFLALLGTTVAPGFDFADYEPGDRSQLAAAYPAFAERIARLTR